MRAPVRLRRLCGVVVGVVVRGHRRVVHAPAVAFVFGVQRGTVVLRVPEHEEPPAVDALGRVHARLVGNGQQFQLGVRLDVFGPHLGVARMGRPEPVVKPAQQGRGQLRLNLPVLEHARHLGGQLVFGHAIVVIDAGLCAPADMQRGMHVRARPVHDAAQLGPIVHVFEIEQLHGRAGDDHAVEVLVGDVVERAVERLQVLLGHVFRVMAGHAQQRYLDLQRRVRKLAQNLRLGGDLGGHEVQQHHAQRADVLVHGAVLRHDEDVFLRQQIGGRQRVGNANGHGVLVSIL